MYIGDDTRTMTFVLREVFHYHTSKINTSSTQMPGELLRIVASPLGAMLTSNSDGTGYKVNTLGFTASRWREIRYVGTRVQFVPLATTGRIDPADITQSASGVPAGDTFSPQGSVHPYDALNFAHWRRWLGGNINLPAWDPNAPADDAIDRSLKYDQVWLSDDRFNHVKLTDGFSFDSVPLRVDLETAALAGNSLFGFANDIMLTGQRMPGVLIHSVTGGKNSAIVQANTRKVGGTIVTDAVPNNYYYSANLDKFFQPQGMLMPTAGKDYHEEGWLPNPFAGLTYKHVKRGTDGKDTDEPTISPGNETFAVNGYLPNFPWFADRTDLSSIGWDYVEGGSTTTNKGAAFAAFTTNFLVRLCMERFYNPIAIIRLPPAYGSMFFWTVYLAHVIQLRKPYLTNSAWTAGIVEKMTHDPTPLGALANDGVYANELSAHPGPTIIQAIGPDPYGLAESPTVLSMSDLAPHMAMHAEPRHIFDEIEEEPDVSEGHHDEAESAERS